MSRTVEDLFASSAPGLKFPTIGTKYTGTITGLQTRQSTNMQRVPEVWADGTPKMELVITLATDLRDPAINQDDGERRLFVSGGLLTALRKAVRDAGATKPEIGGKIAIAYTSDGVPSQPGYNPPKQYQAAYKAPEPGGVANLFDTAQASDTVSVIGTPEPATPPGLDPAALADLLGGA